MLVAATSATIGVSRFGPETKADFFLAGFTGPVDRAWLNATSRTVEAQGAFRYKKTIMFVQGFGTRASTYALSTGHDLSLPDDFAVSRAHARNERCELPLKSIQPPVGSTW